MKLLHPQSAARVRRRGSALLVTFLVLLVLVAIVFQLSIGTNTDARVARNDVTLTTMDLAIESALLDVFDQLETDGQAAAASGTEGGAAGAADAAQGAQAPAGPAAGGGEGTQAVDSREDPWGRVQRSTINEIDLRIFVQDENSKLNVLTLLTPDPAQAEAAFERVVAILDACREGTSEDLDKSQARAMAEAIQNHLRDRSRSVLPRAKLSTDDPQNEDQGLPQSLREFAVLEPMWDGLFRDLRDEDGRVVHSIGSFLTVWSSVTAQANPAGQAGQGGTGAAQDGAQDAAGQATNDGSAAQDANASGASGAQGSGSTGGSEPQGSAANNAAGNTGAAANTSGIAVNVNTAPSAVLKSLIEDREVPDRFWDEVIEYRNLEEEPEEGAEETELEPVYDEYGNEVFQRRVFDSLEELAQVDGYDDLTPRARTLLAQFLSTQSQVFSIYVTARRVTSQEQATAFDRESADQEEQRGDALTRTVRAVVLRVTQGDAVLLVPIVRWEVLDYVPLEVLDYPDQDR